MHRILRALGRGVVILLLAVGALVMVTPLLWMFLASFKSMAEIVAVPPTLLPENFSFQNYIAAFERVPFLRYFINSVLVSLIAVVCVTVTSASAGYALAKFRFRGSSVIFMVFVASLVVPFQTRMIALYQEALQLNITNTIAGVVLPFLVDAFGIFLVRQYMLTLPSELIEAARIDGAGELHIFFRIVMPLASPALATVAILTFLNSWQEFLWPLIVTDNDVARTLPIGLQTFANQYEASTNLQMAGAVVATVPLIIVFMIFQKRIMEGMATSGLK